jgi:hypothetical protein
MTFSHDTDYSQKSIKDIANYLKTYKEVAGDVIEAIDQELSDKDLRDYVKKTHPDFEIILNNCYEILNTTREELSIILKEIRSSIKENHTKRIRAVGKAFVQKNISIGRIWNANFINHDFSNPKFRRLEELYDYIRGGIVTLSELGDIALRLEDFIGSSVVNRIEKVKSINFNDNTAKIKIDNSIEIALPVYRNEHYLCRFMFKKPKDQAIDWSEVYEEMGNPEITDTEKNSKMVGDAVKAINKRISQTMDGEIKLFLWKRKTVTRLF